MAKEEVKKNDSRALLLNKVKEGKVLDMTEMGAVLSELTARPENEITADYIKLKPGESTRIFFQEMTTIKSIKEGAIEGETSPAIRFVTEEGFFGINADTVIVSTCSKLKKPTPLEITCTGTGGSKTREYKTFKIIALD